MPLATTSSPYAVSQPYLWGSGPPTFSTSLAVVPYYPMIWDVNGYYRELGVSVYATKSEIREAYRRKKGWRSIRLTYVLKQLLNRDIRRAYDSMPLGQVFWDRYVEDIVRKRAAQRASQLRRAGYHELAEKESEYDSPFSDLAEEEALRRADWVLSQERATVTERWPWSYYRWQTSCSDTSRLRVWQSALIEALGGQHYEVAVGFMGGMELPSRVQRVGFRLVAFLGEATQPSKDLAGQVADQIKEQESRR